jgi:hypothetical protein
MNALIQLFSHSASFAKYCIEHTKIIQIVSERMLNQKSQKQWYAAVKVMKSFIKHSCRQFGNPFDVPAGERTKEYEFTAYLIHKLDSHLDI